MKERKLSRTEKPNKEIDKIDNQKPKKKKKKRRRKKKKKKEKKKREKTGQGK